MNRIFWAVIFLTSFPVLINSQSIYSASNFLKSNLVRADIDTTKLLSDKPIKSPVGALLRSAVIPGWGQFYNKQYLKGLFVFSVNGTFAYAIYYYNNKWDDTGRSKFRDKRNLYTWYFALSYFLTLVDAYIDAYLFGFEKAVEIATIETGDNSENFVCLKLKFKL